MIIEKAHQGDNMLKSPRKFFWAVGSVIAAVVVYALAWVFEKPDAETGEDFL
jgi:hypothetical protein